MVITPLTTKLFSWIAWVFIATLLPGKSCWWFAYGTNVANQPQASIQSAALSDYVVQNLLLHYTMSQGFPSGYPPPPEISPRLLPVAAKPHAEAIPSRRTKQDPLGIANASTVQRSKHTTPTPASEQMWETIRVSGVPCRLIQVGSGRCPSPQQANRYEIDFCRGN